MQVAPTVLTAGDALDPWTRPRPGTHTQTWKEYHQIMYGNTNKRDIAVKTGAAAVAAGLLVGAVALPAQASAPTGKKCAVSGQVKKADNKVHVCTTNDGKLTWGVGIAQIKVAAKPSVSGGWAKAAEKSGMSAAFGMLGNSSSQPMTIVAATTPYAKAVQMHEVVMKDGAMVMQEKPGGFVIPASGTLELKPGGNHLMFIGLKKEVKAGKQVPVTLYTSNGGSVTIKVLVKVFNGANEEYPGGGHGTMAVDAR